jgi:hypothetical protein
VTEQVISELSNQIERKLTRSALCAYKGRGHRPQLPSETGAFWSASESERVPPQDAQPGNGLGARGLWEITGVEDMAIPTAYLTSVRNLGGILNSIVGAQAPEKFTTRFLKSLDYKSNSDRLVIGVLKGLGFLADDGRPTQRYFEY